MNTLERTMSVARRVSQNMICDIVLFKNPDYPEQGKRYTIAPDIDLDTYYNGQRINIIAIYRNGERVD